MSGALLTEYVYAGDRMLAREQSGAVTYYHQDRLSVRMLTNGSGNWAGTQSHEPFGEQVGERDEGSLISKWRFTNYERDDETGSDYAVNRQYLTNVGRFMRPDPVTGSIANPQSLNRYADVTGDPINLVDPLGLLPLAPGGCGAQYSSCGEVTVCISGWCFPVPVGFDGSGGASFLWGQLPINTQARLSDMGRLPQGFQIFPTYDDLFRSSNPFDHGPGIVKDAQTGVQKKILAELKACDQSAGQAAIDFSNSLRLDPNFVASRAKRAQFYGNVGQAVGSGIAAAKLARMGLSIAPPMAILNAMSMFGVIPSLGDAVTPEDLMSDVEKDIRNASTSVYRKARKTCIKGVRRRYGF